MGVHLPISPRFSYTSDAGFRADLDEQYPRLATAMRAGDRRQVCALMAEMAARRREAQERQQRMLTADPFDPEAQRAIEEHIRWIVSALL